MRQGDLIVWYVEQQNEQQAYSSSKEVVQEIKVIRAIIKVKLIAAKDKCKISYACNTASELQENMLLTNLTFFTLQKLIEVDGHLIVIDDGLAAEGEEAGQSSSSENRILAVAPNYVID